MTCPICDQKPMNCDCTEAERRQYSEISDLEDEVAVLRAKVPRWIPVEERLPDEECRCLVAVRGEVRSATYYPPGKFQPDITHWMPLPEPPEVK